MKTKEFYDEKYKKGYMGNNRHGDWSHTDIQLLRIKETLGQISIAPRKILDYGCGQGAWIDLLSTIFPKARLSGIDISDVAIAKAKTRFPKYYFNTFDGRRAPFSDESFDLIFSYHVLEHVYNIEASINDISRMIKKGGNACIILPCGNKNSFEERIMNWMKDGKETSLEGYMVYHYESSIGHLRRMTSQETIGLFKRNGLTLVKEFYSNHFFGWIDWLVRGHNSKDINEVLSSQQTINFSAKVKLQTTIRGLLLLNWIINKKSLDLSKRRNPPKQVAVFAVKALAKITDRLVVLFSFLEWRFFRQRRNGSAQFLVFKK